MHRRVALLWIALVAFSQMAQASDKTEIQALFATYWSAYTSEDYGTAAAMMYPPDTADFAKLMVPVLLGATKSASSEVRDMASVYFSGVEESKRATLTGAEAMRQFMQFVSRLNPDLGKNLRKSKVIPGEVQVDDTHSTATLHYRMQVEDASVDSTERYSKLDGRWWLRSKTSAASAVEKLKRAIAEAEKEK